MYKIFENIQILFNEIQLSVKRYIMVVGFALLSCVFSLFSKSVNCIPDSMGNITCTDYYSNGSLNVDLRIANKHNPVINKLIFSVQDHANGLYVRNPNCWAADIDLTCISPWKSSPPVYQRAGTLITPRHVILAAHFPIAIGDSIRFITKDNITIARKVIGAVFNTIWTDLWPDNQVLLLDSDVPPSITPCMFLPANYGKFLANNGAGLPTLNLDQEEKAIVGELSAISIAEPSYTRFGLAEPTAPNRLSLFEYIVGGDSGNPSFIILNGKLVLIGVFTWGGAGAGASLTYMANQPTGNGYPLVSINDLIKNVDISCGINTGYKITFFDFSGTSAVDENIKNNDLVYTQGRNLYVKLENTEPVQVSVIDVFGRQVLNEHVLTTEFTCLLSEKGMFIVTISCGNHRCDQTFQR